MEDPEIVENVLGPCRLPYELIENNKSIDSGYLLSPRDLCSLEHIPDFINSVEVFFCFKAFANLF